jgi:hypothetical protein
MAEDDAQGQQGGLQPPGGLSLTSSLDKHVFKAPAPRQSLLGKCATPSPSCRDRCAATAVGNRRLVVTATSTACPRGAHHGTHSLLHLQAWIGLPHKSERSKPSKALC